MQTFSIRIKGIVQGVGFRPFVFQEAKKKGINGWVLNGSNGVEIRFNYPSLTEAREWLKTLVNEAPSLSYIQESFLEQIPTEDFEGFRIEKSKEDEFVDLPLTPDFAMCRTCKREMDDPKDRRYNYAFITCTDCGPRYSITRKVPYDRPVTTMNPFPMCSLCSKEYEDPMTRRHYSQTNSCGNCGVQLNVLGTQNDLDREFDSESEKLDFVVSELKNGKVVAVKGIGGFLLICDATNDDCVNKLRRRKHRPDKPLAVLYQNLDEIEKYYYLKDSERASLTSPVAPIVLLEPRQSSHLSPLIAPELDTIGVMLPYAPILHFISREFNQPLVATSGNVSGSPIVYSNVSASEELSNVADLILEHNREILIPQDDSVVRFSRSKDIRIVLRRSRGLAPNYFGVDFNLSEIEGTMAVGAEMKGAFAIVHRGRIYISQYLGSMDNYLSQNTFHDVYKHLQNVLGFKPNKLISDIHPDYFGTRWCQEQIESGVSTRSYQHHKAHFASVLGENNLLYSNEPILGFIWDGTGLSEDHQIWGSETFLWNQGAIEHHGNIGSVRNIAGDKMAIEPRLSLLAFQDNSEETTSGLFSSEEWDVYQKLKANSKTYTSSMGRFFDAISCLLLNHSKSTYEGQAAMRLETLSRKGWESEQSLATNWSLEFETPFYYQTINHVLREMNHGEPTEVIGFRFHLFLVEWVMQQAERQNIRKLAFSGGVFQNGLLVDLLVERLSGSFDLYFHQELSPNDEGVAFGQLMLELTSDQSISVKH